MPLKTVVKVGNISNLGQARYCSGMGVDMLGIRVINGHPQHMQPELFQEIRGWIVGPGIVAEIYGLSSADEIAAVMENYRPDYFELSEAEYLTWRAGIPLPCLVNLSKERPNTVLPPVAPSGYLLINENVLPELSGGLNSQRTLVKVTSPDRLRDILEQYPVEGIAIDASDDHNALSDILEVLDES